MSTRAKFPIYNVMRVRAVIVAIGLALSATRPAVGQLPRAVEIAALGVWHNKTVPLHTLRGFGAGARLGVWLPLGFEVEGKVDVTFPLNPTFGRIRLFQIGASALYNKSLDNGVSLFLRGGYEKLLPHACDSGQPCSSFGAISAGAGVRIPVSGDLKVRFEGMYRGRSAYQYSSFGAGLGLSWTRSGQAVSPNRGGPDADRDGVTNGKDRCKDTPLGALVDSRGCPSDSDQDGVLDGIDRCPATPTGVAVDTFGCSLKKPD